MLTKKFAFVFVLAFSIGFPVQSLSIHYKRWHQSRPFRGQRRFEPTATVYGTYFMKTTQTGSRFQTIMMFLIGNIGQSVAAVNTEYFLLMGRVMISLFCFKLRL